MTIYKAKGEPFIAQAAAPARRLGTELSGVPGGWGCCTGMCARGHRWSKKLPTGELQNITESKPGWQPHLKRDKENKKTNKHPET